MKLKVLVAALALAAILPVAAFADEASQADKANGARACQALKTSLGASFASTYGTNADKSNAFGKCVSKWTQAEHQNRLAAATACKAEQADASFAAAHDSKSFAQVYGVGKNGANALNRCVQAKRAAASAAAKAAVVAGARSCRAERKTMGADAFAAKYGTNADKSNAFGKCVAKWTQTEHQNRHQATSACKVEQADANVAATHDGKSFAQVYGTGKKGANALSRCVQAKRAAASTWAGREAEGAAADDL